MLQEIKSILTKDGGPVLRFFNVQKPVTISCDASSTGLGGMLLQEERPVVYASRSLTDAESRYRIYSAISRSRLQAETLNFLSQQLLDFTEK